MRTFYSDPQGNVTTPDDEGAIVVGTTCRPWIMSPQARRRLVRTMAACELRDLAQEIAIEIEETTGGFVGDAMIVAIERALMADA